MQATQAVPALLVLPAVPAIPAIPAVPAVPAVPAHRCCSEPIQNEFAPCYASALVYGPDPAAKLEAAVLDLERNQPITSCFTAWCGHCKNNYMLTAELIQFPTPSAHHTHKLGLLRHLRSEGVYRKVGF